MRATLERWLGPEGAAADLPLPALVDVDLAPQASPQSVERAVERAVAGAQFIAHREALAPLTAALRSLGLLAVLLVLLIAAATAAAVVLATRGALDAQRATIDVMHGIGATDEQVARLFQRRIALDALAGGTVGGGRRRHSPCCCVAGAARRLGRRASTAAPCCARSTSPC